MQLAIALSIILHPDRSRILVTRRPEGVHLAGYWEFPGGKVEASEKPEDAAVREAMEEVGLAVIVEHGMLPVVHTYPDRTVHLLPFLCTTVDPDPMPVTPNDARWVHYDSLASLHFPDGNRAIVEALQKELEAMAGAS